MKKLNLVLATLLMFAIVFTGCKKDPVVVSESTLPSNFKVDIPSSISNATAKADKGGKLDGGEIYSHLRTFINVGEGASDIVEGIMKSIAKNNLSQAMQLSYQSDEDNRTKNLTVIENASFEGKHYEYQLNLTDALSEANTDGGMAMQIFWNKSSVIGTTIIKPYNLNRVENPEPSDILYRIDYSEIGEYYDQEMVVYISGLPIPTTTGANDDRYVMETMKMFAGRKGDIVDVYGNSNHPVAWLFDETKKGFNWAFVASSNRTEDIATAEVGLPASNLNTTDRNVILYDNSIHTKFNDELVALGYPQTDIDLYLLNTNGTAYFHNTGFISAGTSPGTSYDAISASMAKLTPYNPSEVSNLKIQFQASVQ